MPPSLPDSARSAIVSKLRAAGCVFAEDEARLLIAAAGSATELDAMVARRVSGEPLEYVLGFAEFCGMRVTVEPGVFVPRRRSEFLVAQAIDGVGRGAVVVDMCCGSGAIGVAVIAQLQRPELHAVDIDPVAARCARANITADRAHVYEGDLYEPLPVTLRGRVDVLVVNAPYVPTDEIELLPAEARVYEARIALDGGVDGLDIQRRVGAAASQWLAPGGRLLIETSGRQAAATVAIVNRSGLIARVATSEDLDATVVIGYNVTVGRALSGQI